MNQQKLESALWRACLYIASFRDCSEETKNQIADNLYDFFLIGSEHQRFEYHLEKISKDTDIMVKNWPQWKREFHKYYLDGDRPE